MLTNAPGMKPWKNTRRTGRTQLLRGETIRGRTNQPPRHYIRSVAASAGDLERNVATSSRAKERNTQRGDANRGVLECIPPSNVPRASAELESGGEPGQMMRHLCELGDFVRRVRVQARFGELSRAPLRLLRVQLCGGAAECEWMARPADQWDADLPRVVGERNVSLQALKDAITVRGILFRVLPDAYSAALRVYRQAPVGYPELIITGTVTREQRAPATVRSVAMRAKLFGFRFWLDEGILENLQAEEYAVNS